MYNRNAVPSLYNLAATICVFSESDKFKPNDDKGETDRLYAIVLTKQCSRSTASSAAHTYSCRAY